MSQKTLKKWWAVYANDEEKRFFVGKDGNSGLCRNTEFDWRSTEALARESGLSKAKIEIIIDKYHKAGIVVQHAKDPEKWGYWEKCSSTVTSSTKDVTKDDQQARVDKAKGVKKK